ncbi:unnamed protein product [Allacma fusca]|uniref:Uncharacterized protein n=1 Tax=Allacma fusca TaxID=39272 RepID=A0A8J2K674_9HEXA|nr:unnamed protein product [Allacma fusca]
MVPEKYFRRADQPSKPYLGTNTVDSSKRINPQRVSELISTLDDIGDLQEFVALQEWSGCGGVTSCNS